MTGNYLIPFGNEAFQGEYRLVQDNDPKHTSKSTKKFLRNRNINHWETPSENPVTVFIVIIPPALVKVSVGQNIRIFSNIRIFLNIRINIRFEYFFSSIEYSN